MKLKILNTLPATMRGDGWKKGGTTNDRTALVEIQRDYMNAGNVVAFTRGALDDVHYWLKPNTELT